MHWSVFLWASRIDTVTFYSGVYFNVYKVSSHLQLFPGVSSLMEDLSSTLRTLNSTGLTYGQVPNDNDLERTKQGCY